MIGNVGLCAGPLNSQFRYISLSLRNEVAFVLGCVLCTSSSTWLATVNCAPGVGVARSWTGSCFLRPSPPTSGLSGRRRGAQLDGDVYFQSSRCLSPPTSGLTRRWGGAQLDGGIRFLRLSPSTSGQARMGRRGARSWTRNLLFMPLATNFGPGLDGAVEGCAALAWSLPFYLSLTGLSTGGQAMLGHCSQYHLRL